MEYKNEKEIWRQNGWICYEYDNPNGAGKNLRLCREKSSGSATQFPVVGRAAIYSKIDAKPDYQKRADLGWQYMMMDVRKAIDKSIFLSRLVLAAMLIIGGSFTLWFVGLF